MNAEKERKAIQAAGEFARTLVRPYITVSSWSVCLYLFATGQSIPEQLWYVAVVAVGAQYGERGVKRLKEMFTKK